MENRDTTPACESCPVHHIGNLTRLGVDMEDWDFVVEKHRLPAAIAGFTADSLLAGIYSVLRQHADGNLFLDNCYPSVVRPKGNKAACKQLSRAFAVVDASWRGIGVIPMSGYALNEEFAAHDARLRLVQGLREEPAQHRIRYRLHAAIADGAHALVPHVGWRKVRRDVGEDQLVQSAAMMNA